MAEVQERRKKTVEASRTEQVHLIMHQHLNAGGRLFGGMLMQWVDEVSGVVAMRHCGTYRVTTAAVDNLQFKEPVYEGEILGIGGMAGQGKLGIANGIMGLHPAGGSVSFAGRAVELTNPASPLAAGISAVSEDRRGVGLLLDETLEWNVAFPAMQIQNKFLKKYGPITWRDTKAIHDVTQKYIDDLKSKCTSSKQKARELSGGNQQKVCLAKAFALQPRFLFVSEPTRGIDVGAKALVLDALKKFNRENGVTVVMISSELEELRTTCDRIAIVSGGRSVGILPATESSETFGALMVSQVK